MKNCQPLIFLENRLFSTRFRPISSFYTPRKVIDVVLVFLLLTLSYFTPFSSVSIVEFEQVNLSWLLIPRKTKICFK